MKRYIILAAIALTSLLGCTKFNSAHTKDVVELATTMTDYIVSEVGGSMPVHVYSNGVVRAEIVGGAPDWADLDKSSLEGDGDFIVYVNANQGYRRMIRLLLTLEGSEKSLEVCVKQKGFEQDISCLSPYATASGVNDTQVVYEFFTQMDDSQLHVDVNYPGIYKDWVSGWSVSNGKLTLELKANPIDISRRANISLYAVDGWDQKKGVELFLTQSDCNGSVGKDITFSRIKSFSTPQGNKIEDDWLLEGVVVSDCTSPNMDLNPDLTSALADTMYSYRTAYVEGLDGTWGMKILFDDPKENNLTFGLKVKMNLYGTTAYEESNPDRYCVTGFSGWNFVSSESGYSVPVKSMKIADLKDSDIYTFVSLEDTEFAFKRGSYADVLETNAVGSAAASASALDGWASLLVDADGNGIYAPVNLMCPWRRTGAELPQGIGTTNGIIVHNNLKRLGDAGRYQIRVIDKNGFQMSDDTDLKEYAYIINSYSNLKKYEAIDSRYKYNKLATIIPSNDVLDATPAHMEMTSENTVVPASRQSDPYTTAKYYNALDMGPDLDGVSPKWVGIGDITTARDWYKWTPDGEFAGYNGFVFTLNTTSLSSARYAEFAFDFAGGYNSAATARSWPAHWCVEYTVDGGSSWTVVNNCVSGKPYVHMRGLPWSKTFYNGQWYQTPAQAGLGFSQHSFRLPQEVLGHENVTIRLRPYDRYIVSLPLDWQDDIEQSQIDYTTDVDIRVRFGFIYLRYR